MPAPDLSFSHRALASLRSYDDFLRLRNAASADALKIEIEHLCKLILDFPDMGRPFPGTGLRMHVTRRYRYRVIYRLREGLVEIVDVMHQGRM